MNYTKPNASGGDDFTPPASNCGQWSIWSVQRNLPYSGQVGGGLGASHNYLALVNPRGEVQGEIHGKPSDHFAMLGADDGNYLQARTFGGNDYNKDTSITQAQPVFSGTQDDMADKFQSGFNSAAGALDNKGTLYNGASLLDGRDTLNSNSVWYTALNGMGHPDADTLANGAFSAPGSTNNLWSTSSNNAAFQNGGDPNRSPNPAYDLTLPASAAAASPGPSCPVGGASGNLDGILPADGSLNGSLLTGFNTDRPEPDDPETQFVNDAEGANLDSPAQYGPIVDNLNMAPASTLLTSDTLDAA